MVLEKKTPDLLAVLTAHTEGNSLAMTVVLRPSMLDPPLPSPSEATKKKRKREKHSGKEGFKDGGKYSQPPNKNPLKSPDLQGLNRRSAPRKG